MKSLRIALVAAIVLLALCMIYSLLLRPDLTAMLRSKDPPTALAGDKVSAIPSSLSQMKARGSVHSTVNEPRLSSSTKPSQPATEVAIVTGGAKDPDQFKSSGESVAISQEVLDTCNDPGMRGRAACTEFLSAVAEMAKESREVSWATSMEQRLQAYVESNFPSDAIRNIDCRATWCSIEVENTDQRFNGKFPYSSPLATALTLQAWMLGRTGTDRIAVLYKRD
jgi:hypothetical protein